jgi:Flp pilus assembly protein TadD
MTARRVVTLLLVALAAYFGLIGYRGVYLLGQGSAGLKLLGVAVLVLPLVGAWVAVAEMRFGLATQRLAERMDADGVEPDPDLPRTPSGRVERAAADALFAQRRVAVEADPGDWRGWYRLAVAYDLAGDRKRARAAMRTAIERAGD